jgi:hypothetical protein
MATGTVDLTAELLSGGLDKLAAKCAITGAPKANTEGVALMLRVVTSLLSPPPQCRHTHSAGGCGSCGLAGFRDPGWIHRSP